MGPEAAEDVLVRLRTVRTVVLLALALAASTWLPELGGGLAAGLALVAARLDFFAGFALAVGVVVADPVLRGIFRLERAGNPFLAPEALPFFFFFFLPNLPAGTASVGCSFSNSLSSVTNGCSCDRSSDL